MLFLQASPVCKTFQLGKFYNLDEYERESELAR